MEQENLNLGLVVGKNLKQFIKNSKYKTQAKFAEAFYTTERTVGRWINEGLNDLVIIQQLAIFFNVTVFTILSKEG